MPGFGRKLNSGTDCMKLLNMPIMAGPTIIMAMLKNVIAAAKYRVP